MVETLKATAPVNGTKAPAPSAAAKKVFGSVKNPVVAASANLNSSRTGDSDSSGAPKATPKKINGIPPKLSTPASTSSKAPAQSPRGTKSPRPTTGSKIKSTAAAGSGLKRPTTSMG